MAASDTTSTDGFGGDPGGVLGQPLAAAVLELLGAQPLDAQASDCHHEPQLDERDGAVERNLRRLHRVKDSAVAFANRMLQDVLYGLRLLLGGDVVGPSLEGGHEVLGLREEVAREIDLGEDACKRHGHEDL